MLLGRRDDLSAVLEARRSAVEGRGPLVVTGERGIGKSALLAEAVRADEGWDVLPNVPDEVLADAARRVAVAT